MLIYIVTSSEHKKKELSKYFEYINVKTNHISNTKDISNCDQEDSLFIIEQTQLLNAKTFQPISDTNLFQEAVHVSELRVLFYQKGKDVEKKYVEKVFGYISPSKKRPESENIYSWDDVFISGKSGATYQEMKEEGVKNSARDLAFSAFIEDNRSLFEFKEKVNLNFNKVEVDEVISFEPFLKNMLENNQYYKVCKKNMFLSNVLSNVLKEGVFIRRAQNRGQRNYWFPGLNAGIPLVAKKDEIHETTFMFHDLMHFIFPDLILTDESEESRRKYILYRMMSEAFTLILADMFFVSLLKDEGIEYDFMKRRIYPLFMNNKFEISLKNIDKVKEILWANTCFALLGEEELLKNFAKNDLAFELYKEKYGVFFKEDYLWTNKNHLNLLKDISRNDKWYKEMKVIFPDLICSAEDFIPHFKIDISLKEQTKVIFDQMFNKLLMFSRNKASSEDEGNALKRYMIGQIAIFSRYKTPYNDMFKNEIIYILNQKYKEDNIDKARDIYAMYLSKLVSDNLITPYMEKNYNDVFQLFSPFYVFYDRKNEEEYSLKDVVSMIFK